MEHLAIELLIKHSTPSQNFFKKTSFLVTVTLLQRAFLGFARKRRWWGMFALPWKTALFLIILAAEYSEIFLLPFFFPAQIKFSAFQQFFPPPHLFLICAVIYYAFTTFHTAKWISTLTGGNIPKEFYFILKGNRPHEQSPSKQWEIVPPVPLTLLLPDSSVEFWSHWGKRGVLLVRNRIAVAFLVPL